MPPSGPSERPAQGAEPEDLEPTAESPRPVPGESPAPQRSRGGGARKSRTLEARAARRVKGRTIYMGDDLFERLLVQSHRRDMTISDYVSSILERSVPDHRQVVRGEPDRGEGVA